MRTIHKYQFEAGKLEQEFVMPEGATVLSVQNQNEKLTMWAAINTGARLEKRRFTIALAGREEPKLRDVGRYLMKFIGTVQFDDGNFVCHVFEN